MLVLLANEFHECFASGTIVEFTEFVALVTGAVIVVIFFVGLGRWTSSGQFCISLHCKVSNHPSVGLGLRRFRVVFRLDKVVGLGVVVL